MSKKIAIATGGSGGHVFPAIALSEQLEYRNIEYFIISDRRTCHLIKQERAYIMNIKTITGSLFKKMTGLFSILSSAIKIKKIFDKEKPDILVVFGSYASIPTALIAIILKIPIIVHEQNMVLGKSNRIIAKRSLATITTFPYTEKLSSKNSLLIGNPVRNKILKLYNTEYKKIEKNPQINILILGGSQGSNEIDRISLDAIIKNSNKHKINVTHQCRLENIKEIVNFYNLNSISNTVAHFFDNIEEKLKNADIVICRSGSTTIAENLIAGKPAIYIPMKSSADNHQLKNAKFIADNNAGILFDNKIKSIESLDQIINNLISNPNLLETMSNNARKLSTPSAAAKLAEIIIKYASIKNPEPVYH